MIFGRAKKLQSQVDQLQSELAGIKSQRAGAQPLSNVDAMLDIFSVSDAGGPVVNERTAMQASAVYACVRLISGSVAGLPLKIYRNKSNGKRERVTEHDAVYLLNNEPCPLMTSATAREYSVTGQLLKGDQFSYIRRAGGGEFYQITPLDPSKVVVGRMESDKSRLIYLVYDDDGGYKSIHQDDMIHVPGVGFNGLRSMSPIRWAARDSVGLALSAQEYSVKFFNSGAHPDIVLQTDKKMTDEQIEQLRKTYVEKYGGMKNMRMPMVLSEGVQTKQLTINAEDAQLMEARKFQVVELCRIFGVPPFMVGETEKTSAWGTGIEQMSTGFVLYTLRQHLTSMEQEYNRKLFSRSSGLFCEFELNGLLRGDIETRGDYYRKGLGGSSGPGWMTPNEVRKLENQPALDDPAADKLAEWSPDKKEKTEGGSEDV